MGQTGELRLQICTKSRTLDSKQWLMGRTGELRLQICTKSQTLDTSLIPRTSLWTHARCLT